MVSRILPASVDYTDKDFAALRDRLFKLIDSVFPTWSEKQKANFANVLVELYAFTGDVITYYQDNQAAEAFVPSATQRRSLLALAKRSGYTPAGARAGTTTITLTLSAPTAGDVSLPAGSGILTAEITDPVRFQTLADVLIPAGQTQASVLVEHSRNREDIFTSDGTPFQAFKLSATPYLDGSAEVTAANGSFSQVDDVLDSTSSDKHFVVTVDQNDRATLTFGDGTNGMIPTGSIVVSYKTGGGDAGALEPGALKRLESSLTDTLGNPVRVTVSQPHAVNDATPRESNAQMRQQIPRAVRVQGRCVAREDYEISAESVAGVARALHLTTNEDLNLGENRGILFLVPTGGGAPSQALKDAVAARLATDGETPGMNAYQLTIQGAAFLVCDVHAVVYRQAGTSKAVARANIEAALDEFFAIMTTNDQGEVVKNPRMNFGYYFQAADGTPSNELAWSDVHNAVRDASGIRKVDPGQGGFLLNGLRADAALEMQQFPTLGTVTLVDGDDGQPF